MPGSNLGGQLPVDSGITGTTRIGTGGPNSQYLPAEGYRGAAAFDNTGAGYATGVTTGTSMMGPAIQTIWSKEILFQSMPVLRFEQFAVKKTELGTMPGLTVNFMRYNNLPLPAGPLVEGVRMKTHAITANQYAITVAEQGFAVAVSELLLNASFDDVMASSSRLLGRNMALYMDLQARQTLQRTSSVVFGYQKPAAINVGYGVYEPGLAAANIAAVSGAASGSEYWLHPHTVKDGVEVLSSKNIPRLGETYVCFAHPHQTRRLRDTPEWIETTKYAAPGNFMLGEVGRIDDVVFIETTQVGGPLAGATEITPDPYPTVPGSQYTDSGTTALDWRGTALGQVGAPDPSPPFPDINNTTTDLDDGYYGTGTETQVPGWGAPWVPPGKAYEGIMLGDNAFGHAISLPVELRDGGVLDFGREHALAWYSIWGWGLVTESAVVKLVTN
jgi:N4-gp56 family major capsid protein